ncbi:hypothetical protein B0H16DRAFT_1740095 [Mycena metata]|uniref:Uncharacterized protein n=1 Tax=Mycena metata TaxID=1033252 RepID=A0AAD7HEK1_9AGAR|nr:hypothetical protein B0H16DRAFT_1740095 [Mycena metata]
MDGDGDEMNEGGPPRTTPRNSVVFPAGAAGDDATPGRNPKANGKTEGGRGLHVQPGEAVRVADVLRDWVGGVLSRQFHGELHAQMNAGSSPYEDEDDFFARGSQRTTRALPAPYASA